jgi:hypothetical protein
MVWAALPVKVDAQAEFRGCLSSPCYRDCLAVWGYEYRIWCAEQCCPTGRAEAPARQP